MTMHVMEGSRQERHLPSFLASFISVCTPLTKSEEKAETARSLCKSSLLSWQV